MSLSILSLKPGHDGSISHVCNYSLQFALEAEKNSFPRYSSITPDILIDALSLLESPPDVLCVSGWVKGFHSIEPSLWAGYYGHTPCSTVRRKGSIFRKPVEFFSSTHERSHLLCGYGLSPYPQGAECYVLVWEGNIGDFYEFSPDVKIRHIGKVLEDPGNKYSFLFSVADPDFPPIKGTFRFEDAGKLMALAAYSDRSEPAPYEKTVIDYILSRSSILLSTSKEELRESPIYNAGVRSNAFKSIAGKFSDALFDVFYKFAKLHLRKGLPLIITGGCGLNCEWNSKWRDSELFPDVFVPPCANDTGSAIGTAVDAQLFYTGNAKLQWNVYAGLKFENDEPVGSAFSRKQFSYSRVAEFLQAGNIVAWVQGRCEIGPRALGNRSILAHPFDSAIRDRLNQIKIREDYRPIAPVCLEEELPRITGSSRLSPHMLYFYRLIIDALPAITHVDRSARIQTVNECENRPLTELLRAFKSLTGFGVLCNTSLNFKGRGFINRMSDLLTYCDDTKIDGFVVDGDFYVRN